MTRVEKKTIENFFMVNKLLLKMRHFRIYLPMCPSSWPDTLVGTLQWLEIQMLLWKSTSWSQIYLVLNPSPAFIIWVKFGESLTFVSSSMKWSNAHFIESLWVLLLSLIIYYVLGTMLNTVHILSNLIWIHYLNNIMSAKGSVLSYYFGDTKKGSPSSCSLLTQTADA